MMANYRALAAAAARRHGVPVKVFLAQINQESGFQPHVVSPAGARGIAQFMPGTARSLGVNPDDPASALDGAARLMGRYIRQFGNVGDALRAYNAGPGAVKASRGYSETNNYVRTILGAAGHVSANVGQAGRSGGTFIPGMDTRRQVPTFDTEGYLDAERKLTLAKLFRNQHRGNALFASGLLSTLPVDRSSFEGTTTIGKVTPGRYVGGGGSSGSSSSSGGGGVTHFDGKEVAAWMVPALRFAKQHGWKGTITSGVRTRSEQAALYARRGSNPYPVAKPGSSNHEVENGGAVDVTDPAGLARAMARYRGRKLRQGTAIGDPIHFSRTGR